MSNTKKIFDLIKKEEQRQLSGIELIASENFTSPDVMSACGSVLTNKYAEGYPGKRYYGGCEVVDEIENIAIEKAKVLFGAEYANVQPHSGSQANAAVFHAFLQPGDKLLGFDLAHGGHLTHGSSVNFSGTFYKTSFYGVEKETGLLNYDKINDVAKKEQPNMIIAGASAYSRDMDFKKFREIADSVGAFLLADISHPSGLIAKGLLNSPIPHCHVVTTTTHKTLRGPRGGLILIGKDFELLKSNNKNFLRGFFILPVFAQFMMFLISCLYSISLVLYVREDINTCSTQTEEHEKYLRWKKGFKPPTEKQKERLQTHLKEKQKDADFMNEFGK